MIEVMPLKAYILIRVVTCVSALFFEICDDCNDVILMWVFMTSWLSFLLKKDYRINFWGMNTSEAVSRMI